MNARLPKHPRVVILGPPNRTAVQSEASRVQARIRDTAEVVAVDLEFKFDFDTELGRTVDLVLVVGGDGSILQAARQMGKHQRPVLGINCGRLGFLAAVSPEEFLEHWPRIAQGHHRIVDHLMLDTTLIRDGEIVTSHLLLNEVAVLGGPPYRILEMDLYSDDLLATRYRCDGLIVSTPIGSTAHNLSAGGPILRRSLQAIVISPISPHTLTYRPLVDSADAELELRIVECNESTGWVVDGRMLSSLKPGDQIRIRRADINFQMVVTEHHNDYRALREKLGWGGSVPVRRSSLS